MGIIIRRKSLGFYSNFLFVISRNFNMLYFLIEQSFLFKRNIIRKGWLCRNIALET